MEQLQKYVDQILDTIGRSQIVRYVMIYMLAWGILSLCLGVFFIGTGVLGGVAGALGSGVLSQAGTSPETQEAVKATGQLVAVSFGAILNGLFRIIAGPVMIVVGLGLRGKANWSRMGVVIAATIAVISGLLGLFTGDTLFGLIGIIVDAFIAYVFYTDAGIKAEFGK